MSKTENIHKGMHEKKEGKITHRCILRGFQFASLYRSFSFFSWQLQCLLDSALVLMRHRKLRIIISNFHSHFGVSCDCLKAKNMKYLHTFVLITCFVAEFSDQWTRFSSHIFFYIFLPIYISVFSCCCFVQEKLLSTQSVIACKRDII